MSIRVYEIIAAGAAKGYFAQIFAKMAQRRRILRFCNAKRVDRATASIVCNNYQQDLEKACMLYRMGYADAVIIAGTEAWSESEKTLLNKLTADNKVKVINLDDMDVRCMLD